MPPANDKLAQGNTRLRVLAYGDARTRKTWWACAAAEVGFNVVLFDVDDGHHIIKNLSVETRSRIQVIDLVSTIDKAVAGNFLVNMLTGKKFIWDEIAKQVRHTAASVKETHSHYEINARAFDKNTVLVLDSWTSLVQAIRTDNAAKQNVDLSSGDKLEWELYSADDLVLNFILDRLHALDCHYIVVGHPVLFQKKDKEQKKVISQRLQPISSSAANAAKLAKHFSDVLHFSLLGEETRIDTRPDPERDGGSRNMAPKIYAWKDLQFKHICAAWNIPTPQLVDNANSATLCPGITYYAPGVIPPVDVAVAANNPLKAIASTGTAGAVGVAKPAVIKNGLTGLLGAKK